MSLCWVKFYLRLAFIITWWTGGGHEQLSITLNFPKAAVASHKEPNDWATPDCDDLP